MIGITDLRKGLGDIVYVEVETIGKPLEAGSIFGTVRSSENCFRSFYSRSRHHHGTHAALANAPELVNTDPYGEGWMIKMTVTNPPM